MRRDDPDSEARMRRSARRPRSLASLTIAQAAGIHLSLPTELLMMLTFMMTSKGVAGVPRAALVIIAAGCAAFNLPGEAGVATILAVDEAAP